MAKSRKKTTTTEFTSAEVQESSNILFDNTLEKMRKEFSDLHIIKTSEEHQKDRGIDYQIELVLKSESKTTEVFKIQNKGTADALKPLTKTENSGLISFQVSNRHIRYYRYEFPWPLIFTVCDLESKKIYWHPVQLDDQVDERVQSSIAEQHESIQIYIDPKKVLTPENFKKFLEDISKSYVEQFFRINEERLNPLDTSSDVEIDRTKPILDQIFDLVDYLYDEVQYLPLHLLTKNFPFKKSETFNPYYHRFKLYTDNEEIIELFGSIEVKDNGDLHFLNTDLIKDVIDYDNKAKSVLKKLSQNHIYGIISNKSRKEVSTRYFKSGECDCVACRYFRLDFKGAIDELEKTDPTELIAKFKCAYMHYQLGNYMKSAKLLEKCALQAKEEQKDILFLITQYNLKKLGRLISNNYYDFEIIQYGKKLQDINLDKAVFKVPSKSHNRKMLLWIKDQNFFYQQSYEIHSNASKLRNEYQGHIGGGRGSAYNYDELISSYAQLNSFVNGNYVIYDKYGEYKAQTEEFIEGLFAAFAMKDHQGNMPSQIIDYHIQRLIFDGEHKSIQRYFNKYHLKPISYKHDGDSSKFISIIKNLLRSNHEIKEIFNTYSAEDGGYWRNHYPEIFCNTLTVAAIIEMSSSDAEQIAEWIMQCFESGDLHSPDCYSQVNYFLQRKKDIFCDQTIERLLSFFLSYKDFSSLSRIQFLGDEAKKRSINIKVPVQTKKKIFEESFSNEHDNRFNMVIYLYPCVSSTVQKEIFSRILKKLSQKFDDYQFYYAAIYNIIPFSSELLEIFVKNCVPDLSKHTFKSMFYSNEDNQYPPLDMLINLCFKNNTLPQKISNLNFFGFGKYYDWLLDIDNFDYSEFKIDWLDLYPTRFYHDEFKKHNVLKDQLENYLKTNRDERFERLYFDLYKS
ncbi:MAG: DUF4365 domain-containing protein [Flavobacterium sp.]|nr:MAG: DUF4365 domain-containing protein [Flavobacterium sp.]